VTASRRDPPGFRLALPMLAVLAASTGCRAGLPPDPPDADPVNASANIPLYRPPANPYETSAFAGAPPPAASGHEGHGNMNHGQHTGHGAGSPPAAPAPSDQPMDHSGHAPTPAKPTPVDHSAHPGKAAAAGPTEPRR
jgi:hypothetical protein